MKAHTRILLVCLLAVFAAATAYAAPDYKQLKEDITALTKNVNEVAEASTQAEKALTANREAQAKASGSDLANLKRDARTLARAAGEKADALTEAQQKLADKQGELRSTAAAHAVKQLSAAGNIEDRVGEANNALADWKEALGALPKVPALRPLDGIADPDEQGAIRRQDKKVLEAFDKWAGAEEDRIDKEIKQATSLVDGHAKFKDSQDGGKVVIELAKSMKKTLEARKKDVGQLRKTAQDRIKAIK